MPAGRGSIHVEEQSGSLAELRSWAEERALLFGEGGLSPSDDEQLKSSDSEGGVTPGKKPRFH